MTLNMLLMMAGVKAADLSTCDDPAGRVDFLASKVIEHVVNRLGGDIPENVVTHLQATYHAARPLIDGLLVKHLGHVRIPQESLKAVPEVLHLLQERKAS